MLVFTAVAGLVHGLLKGTQLGTVLAGDTSGDDVAIRLWQAGDEDALAALASSRRVWRNLTNRFPHPYTREHAEAWVAAACTANPLYTMDYAIVVK